MNNTRSSLYLIIFGLLLLIMAGCQYIVIPLDASITRATEFLIESSPTIPQYTKSFSTIATSPLTPTITRAIYPGDTSTRTFHPSKTSTGTPQPTLPPSEAQSKISDLLKNNGGCRLPCWWGIYPGVTKWVEAKAFLQTFTSLADSTGNDRNGRYRFEYPVPETFRFDGEGSVNLQVRNGIVDNLLVSNFYTLSNLLTDYGKPTEVWIWAVSAYTQDLQARYSLAIFYQDRGILSIYDGRAEKGKVIPICPDRIDLQTSALYLWSAADTELTFEKIGPMIVFGKPTRFNKLYPLEDATDINLTQFYETYIDSGNSKVCFNMPDPDLIDN